MRTVLNIIWVVFGGFWLFLGYVAAGILACILIVTIPAGVAAFRIAGYVLWPFGRTVVRQPGAGAGSSIGNVVWFIIAGWWLCLAHLVTALMMTLTIVGIIDAVVNLKMIPLAASPFGKMVVPVRQSAQGPPYGPYPPQY